MRIPAGHHHYPPVGTETHVPPRHHPTRDRTRRAPEGSRATTQARRPKVTTGDLWCGVSGKLCLSPAASGGRGGAVIAQGRTDERVELGRQPIR
ncbi:hypothetical protein GCM10029976_027190 [Kribbella albertanoniae]